MTVMAYIQAHKMPPPASELNSRTKSYKFLGALLITLGVPSTAYTLYFACSEHGCPPQLGTLCLIQAVSSKEWWLSLYDPLAMRIFYTCLVHISISGLVCPAR